MQIHWKSTVYHFALVIWIFSACSLKSSPDRTNPDAGSAMPGDAMGNNTDDAMGNNTDMGAGEIMGDGMGNRTDMGAGEGTGDGMRNKTDTGEAAADGGGQSDLQQQLVSYTQTIQPILNANCLSCHGQRKARGNYRVDNYQTIFTPGSSAKPPITANDPENSYIWWIEENSASKCGLCWHGFLTKAEREMLKTWINQGALNN